jgi:hypothetical protein
MACSFRWPPSHSPRQANDVLEAGTTHPVLEITVQQVREPVGRRHHHGCRRAARNGLRRQLTHRIPRRHHLSAGTMAPSTDGRKHMTKDPARRRGGDGGVIPRVTQGPRRRAAVRGCQVVHQRHGPGRRTGDEHRDVHLAVTVDAKSRQRCKRLGDLALVQLVLGEQQHHGRGWAPHADPRRSPPTLADSISPRERFSISVQTFVCVDLSD